jgi:hypothetical protein
MKTDRRDFLKQVTGLTAAMTAVPVLMHQSAEAETVAPEAADASDSDVPFIVTGRFALELEGVFAGFLKGFGGGDAFGEVVDEAPDAQGFVKKHLNAPFYDEIVIEVGPGMSQAFWDWIKTTFAREIVTHSGAILGVDSKGEEKSRLNFTDALVTEIDFPALDAASKAAAKITITLLPAQTMRVPSLHHMFGVSRAKKWFEKDFALSIDNLAPATSKVNKIEALLVKQTYRPGSATRVPIVEIPDLVVTLAEVHAQPFFEWHNDFVIMGNNGDAMERGGMLRFLTPNLQFEYFRIDFSHLGIFSLSRADSKAIARDRAAMYCEDMTLTVGSLALLA